ncbi:family 4 glycosyl hydrolase [Candidatus Roseilinea sp. NK_OTU-006]|jgi:alpha-galactosidase|uniref:family 4 glycosyl hydrolase n=1 Tax=Candidatus Roseilinea sp. NK_OTU-006 TaxID=2704250 RepID=UPI00145D2899|nr:alpha-glucosidase/alpha-galactosidase [Candidatus Roseilinea sp. NK_OTU-006]
MSTKIVVIGAGSVSFGPAILRDLFAFAGDLRGSEIWLVDINAEALDVMARYADKLNAAFDQPFTLHATTDRREALPGAHFVIVSVAVDRLATWKLDWQIPLQHGVRHVLGENGGPGGLSHALRHIPLLLDIARDAEQLAPQAMLLNFTNPMSRLCMALDRYTRVRFVGLCHQIGEGYRIVNRALGLVPETGDRWADMHTIQQRIHITAAGLNHFTFILDLRDAQTGEDLYPLLRAQLAQMPADFELMSRRLMDVFGLFCASGDIHAGEYVGFAAETIALTGYDFHRYEQHGRKQWEQIQRIADSTEADLGALRKAVRPSGERAVPIIHAMLRDLNQYELSANIRNDGCISNLPGDAIVEVPAIVNARGVHGIQVGPLPKGLAAIMRREIEIQELVVEAGVKGDRNAALQALLLDPHIHSYAQATHLLDDLLKAHAEHLPQFA